MPVAVSVLAGAGVVGGQGLDLGDGEVDGAGGGDGRQGAATPITTGAGGRVGDLDRERRGTTQVGRAAVEGDRAGARALRHPLVPGNTEPGAGGLPVGGRQLQARRPSSDSHRRRPGRRSRLDTRWSLTSSPHPGIHPHQRRTLGTDLRIRLNRRGGNLHHLPRRPGESTCRDTRSRRARTGLNSDELIRITRVELTDLPGILSPLLLGRGGATNTEELQHPARPHVPGVLFSLWQDSEGEGRPRAVKRLSGLAAQYYVPRRGSRWRQRRGFPRR